MKKSKLTKILSLLLALLVVFGTIPTSIIPVSAADNADGSGGSDGSDTSAGTYNTIDSMWKVSVYVALNDKYNAETTGASANLAKSNCWVQYGDTIYLSRNNNTRLNNRLSSTIFFWGDKVDLMKQSSSASGVSLVPKSYTNISSYVLHDNKAPYIPINGYNTIENVKKYFANASNFLNILQKIAAIKTGQSKDSINTAAEFLAPIANKNVTIDGVTKKVYSASGTKANSWHNSKGATTKDANGKTVTLSPFGANGASTAAVDWLIVYEPMILSNPVGKVGGKDYVCATPTEYAVLRALGSNAMNTSGLGNFICRTFPSSVYLEKSWLGYKKGYDLSSNTTPDVILSTFGWGMRHTAGSNKDDPDRKYPLEDYSITVSANKSQVKPNETVVLTYTIKNHTDNAKIIPVYVGAIYYSGNDEFRYDTSDGKGNGSITINKSKYDKKGTKGGSVGNDTVKWQYTNNKFANVSLRANGQTTIKVNVKVGTGFTSGTDILFTGYANWWNGTKYSYKNELNTGNNFTNVKVRVLSTPETKPVIRINLVDKSGTESVAGKQFAVWMYSYTNKGVTKYLPSTAGNQQSFVGIITTNSDGVGELDLTSLSNSTGTKYDESAEQWQTANGTYSGSLWTGAWSGNVITYSNGKTGSSRVLAAKDGSGYYETNRPFSTLFGSSISTYDTLGKQYGALLHKDGDYASASSKTNCVRFVVRPITNIGSDANPLYYYKTNTKWDVYGNKNKNGTTITTQAALAAGDVKYATSKSFYNSLASDKKSNLIPFDDTDPKATLNAIYTKTKNSNGKYGTKIYQDLWYPMFSENGSTVAETTITIEPTRGNVKVDVIKGDGYENAPLTNQPFILMDSNGNPHLKNTNSNSTCTFTNIPVGPYNVFPVVAGDFNLDGSFDYTDLELDCDVVDLPYSDSINTLLCDLNGDGKLSYNLADGASDEERVDAGILLFYAFSMVLYEVNGDGLLDSIDYQIAETKWNDVIALAYLKFSDGVANSSVFNKESTYEEMLAEIKKIGATGNTATAIAKGKYNEQCLATGATGKAFTTAEKNIWYEYVNIVENDFRQSFAYRFFKGDYDEWLDAISGIEFPAFKFGSKIKPNIQQDSDFKYDVNISANRVYDAEHYYEPMSNNGQTIYRYTNNTYTMVDDFAVKTAIHDDSLLAGATNSHTFEVCKRNEGSRLYPSLNLNLIDETGDSLNLSNCEFAVSVNSGSVAGNQYYYDCSENIIEKIKPNKNGIATSTFTNVLNTKGKHDLYYDILDLYGVSSYISGFPVSKVYADLFCPTSSGHPLICGIDNTGRYANNEMEIAVIPTTSFGSEYYYVFNEEELGVEGYNQPKCTTVYSSIDEPAPSSSYSKTVTISIRKRPGTVRVNLEKNSGYALGENGLIQTFILVDKNNNVHEGKTVLANNKETSYVEFKDIVGGKFRVVPFIYGDCDFNGKINEKDTEIIEGYAEANTVNITETSIAELRASDLNHDGAISAQDVVLIKGLVDKSLTANVDGEGDVLISNVYKENHAFLPMDSTCFEIASGLFTTISSGEVIPAQTVNVTFSIGSISSGSILIQLEKTDRCWNGNIENQEIMLYSNGTLVSKLKTNSKGEVLFTNLMVIEDTVFELRANTQNDSCHSWFWNNSNNTVTKADLDAAGKNPVVRKMTLDTPCTGTIRVTATRKGNVVIIKDFEPEYDIIGVKEDGSTVILNHLVIDKNNGGGVAGSSGYKEVSNITINATADFVAYRVKANPESKKHLSVTYDNVFGNTNIGTFNSDEGYLEITIDELRKHNHNASVNYFIAEAGKIKATITKDASIASGDSLNNIAKDIAVKLNYKETRKTSEYYSMYSYAGRTAYEFSVSPTVYIANKVTYGPCYQVVVDDSKLSYPYYITTQKAISDLEVKENKTETVNYKVGAYGTLNVTLKKSPNTWNGNVNGIKVGLYRGNSLVSSTTTDKFGNCQFTHININANYTYTLKVIDEAPACHEWQDEIELKSSDFINEYSNGYKIDVEVMLDAPCKAKYEISFVKKDSDGNLVPAPSELTKNLYLSLVDDNGVSYGDMIVVDEKSGTHTFNLPINGAVTATQYTLSTDFSNLPSRYEILQMDGANLAPTTEEFRKHDHTIKVVYEIKIRIPPTEYTTVKVTLSKDVSVHENDALTKFKVHLVDSDNFVVPGTKFVDENGVATFENVPVGEYTAKFIEYDTPPYSILHTTASGEKIEEPTFSVEANKTATVPFIVYAKGKLNVTLTDDETSWLQNFAGQSIVLSNNETTLSKDTDENGFVSLENISLDPSSYDNNKTFEITGILTEDCFLHTDIKNVTIDEFKNEYANGYTVERTAVIYTPCEGTVNIKIEGYKDINGEIKSLSEATGNYASMKFYLKDNKGNIVSDVTEIGEDGELSFNVVINGIATYDSLAVYADTSEASYKLYRTDGLPTENYSFTIEELRVHAHSVDATYVLEDIGGKIILELTQNPQTWLTDYTYEVVMVNDRGEEIEKQTFTMDKVLTESPFTCVFEDIRCTEDVTYSFYINKILATGETQKCHDWSSIEDVTTAEMRLASKYTVTRNSEINTECKGQIDISLENLTGDTSVDLSDQQFLITIYAYDKNGDYIYDPFACVQKPTGATTDLYYIASKDIFVTPEDYKKYPYNSTGGTRYELIQEPKMGNVYGNVYLVPTHNYYKQEIVSADENGNVSIENLDIFKNAHVKSLKIGKTDTSIVNLCFEGEEQVEVARFEYEITPVNTNVSVGNKTYAISMHNGDYIPSETATKKITTNDLRLATHTNATPPIHIVSVNYIMYDPNATGTIYFTGHSDGETIGSFDTMLRTQTLIVTNTDTGEEFCTLSNLNLEKTTEIPVPYGNYEITAIPTWWENEFGENTYYLKEDISSLKANVTMNNPNVYTDAYYSAKIVLSLMYYIDGNIQDAYLYNDDYYDYYFTGDYEPLTEWLRIFDDGNETFKYTLNGNNDKQYELVYSDWEWYESYIYLDDTNITSFGFDYELPQCLTHEYHSPTSDDEIISTEFTPLNYTVDDWYECTGVPYLAALDIWVVLKNYEFNYVVNRGNSIHKDDNPYFDVEFWNIDTEDCFIYNNVTLDREFGVKLPFGHYSDILVDKNGDILPSPYWSYSNDFVVDDNHTSASNILDVDWYYDIQFQIDDNVDDLTLDDLSKFKLNVNYKNLITDKDSNTSESVNISKDGHINELVPTYNETNECYDVVTFDKIPELEGYIVTGLTDITEKDFKETYDTDTPYVVYQTVHISKEKTTGDFKLSLIAGDRVHPEDTARFDIEVTGPDGFKDIINNVAFGYKKLYSKVPAGEYTAKVTNINDGSCYIDETIVNATTVKTDSPNNPIVLTINANWTAIIDYDKDVECWFDDAELDKLQFKVNNNTVIKTGQYVDGTMPTNRGLAAISTKKAITSITTLPTIPCHKALDNDFKEITETDFENAWKDGYVVTRKMFINTTCAGKMSIKVMNANKDLGISKNIFFTLYGIDAKGNKTVIQENIKGTTEDNRTANYVIENIDISGNTNYVSYQIVPNVTTYEFNGTQCYLILNHLPEMLDLLEFGSSFTVADLRLSHTHDSEPCGLHTATQEDEAGNKIEDEIVYVVDEAGKVKVNIEVSDYLDGFVDVNAVKNASTFTVGTVKHESVDFGKALQLEENTHKVSLDLGSLAASNYFIEDVKVVTETKNSSTINGDKTVDVDVVKNGSTEITYTIGAKGKINLTLKKGSDALFDPPANTQVEVKLNGVETDYSPVTIEKLGSTSSIPNINLSKDGTYSFEVITEATTPNYWEEIADVTVTQMKKASNNKFTANRDVVYNSIHYDYSIVINPPTINVETGKDFTFTVTVTDKRGNGSTTQPILELYWDNEEIGGPISVEFDKTTGIATYTFTTKAPATKGTYTITGYVNRKDKYYEIDKSDNTATAQVSVSSGESDLYLNYVPLNTDLRKGEETVVSFIAHNTGSKDVLKEHEVALEATLTYKESYGGASKTISIGDNTEELKAVVIPSVEKGGENLIYVRFTVPENIYSVQYINAKLNVNANSKWSEENLTNNTAQIPTYSLFHPGDSSNPGYMEKALSAPNGYVSKIDTPNLTEYNKYSGVEINGFTITKTIGNKAQWSVWEEQNDKELIARTYGANVYAKSIVKVDNRCLTSKKVNSTVSMKSGYAVTMAVIPNIVTSGSGQHSLDFAVTDCQLATAYFPEVSYNKTEYGKYSILDKIDTASEFNTSQFTSANTSNVGTETHDFPILGTQKRWELPLNTKSNFTAFLQEENASIATQMTRKHFTPLWWKDGAKYEIQTEVSRVWTPSGVIANGDIAKARTTTGASSSPVDLIINGSVYDDYYTVR